jgi:predicted transcriptional regulator
MASYNAGIVFNYRPTTKELEILGVLWRRGSCSVREVHEELAEKNETGYTTVLKLMQIMVDKGLVHRDEQNRAHIYTALITEEQARTGLVDELVAKAFGGSAHKLALHALSSAPVREEELEQIRILLDELRGKK